MGKKKTKLVPVEAELVDDSTSELIISKFNFDLNKVVPLANVNSFVSAIGKSWNKFAEGILEVGILLGHAKTVLSREDFNDVKERIQFSTRTIDRLIAIGNYKKFETHVSLLSPSWSTLYELTTLTDKQFDKAVANKQIHKGMMRKDVKVIREGKQSVGTKATKVNQGKVKAFIIYCDESKLESLNMIRDELEELEYLHVDDSPLTNYSERESKKIVRQWNTVRKVGRRKAIKAIRDFRKGKIREIGKGRFAQRYGEVNDFFESDSKREDLVRDLTDDGKKNIDEVLAIIDSDLACEDFQQKELRQIGLI